MSRRVARQTVAMLKNVALLPPNTTIAVGTGFNRQKIVANVRRMQNGEFIRLQAIINIPRENVYKYFEHDNILYCARIK